EQIKNEEWSDLRESLYEDISFNNLINEIYKTQNSTLIPLNNSKASLVSFLERNNESRFVKLKNEINFLKKFCKEIKRFNKREDEIKE
ncbi:6172_t:CDS:2, partial [Acaulospora morrowiae]